MMMNNLPDYVNFKFSTYNDYEAEYSETFKKASKEVNLNVAEKLAISLRPLFRRGSALMHISTGVYVTMLFFLYCFVCAVLFTYFEADHYLTMTSIYHERKKYIRNLFSQEVCRSCSTSALCTNKSRVASMMNDYEKFLSEYALQFRDEKHPWPWTLGHTFPFTIWVYSTIGDGKMYPVTPMGRVFCMISAFLGIPFFLLVITYHGRAINEFFRLIYNNRNFMERYPSEIQSPLDEEEDFDQRTKNPTTDRKPPTYSLKFDEADKAGGNELESHVGIKRAEDSSSSAPSTSTLRVITSSNRPGVEISLAETVIHIPHADWRNRIPDHISILPTKAAFVILFFYILLGAVLIENRVGEWNFLTSYYYLFITMSTIGFGDVDPWANLTLVHYFYIMIGIAMLAMLLESIKVTFKENFVNGMQKVLKHLKVIPLMDNIIIVPTELSIEEMNPPHSEREQRNP